MLEYLSIGQIVNTHGVRGEVKVFPLTENMDRFSQLKDVYIEKNNELTQLSVVSVKYLSTMVVIKLKDIDSIEDAQKLKNMYIKVHRNNAVKLPKDNFFICDVIDMDVYSTDATFLGKVKDVMKTGNNDVFVVENNKKEILIPALKTIFKEMNMEERKIVVELPEGLIE